jgi:hypothetical protein
VRREPLTLGCALYVLAAYADIHWTLKGMDGALGLEGNVFLRGVMARFGIAGGLVLDKAAVGALCFVIAKYGEPEIKRGAAWIEKVPSTRWARAWMKSGDRSWIAYVPLYGTALFQLLAAAGWLVVLRR